MADFKFMEWEIEETSEGYSIRPIGAAVGISFKDEHDAYLQILHLLNTIQDRRYYKNPNVCGECGTILKPHESTCPKCGNLVIGT